MSYRSILVNLDIDGPVVPVVKAAADLAVRMGARLIGFCSADAPMPMAGPESGALAAEAWIQMRENIESRFSELRGKFGDLSTGTVAAEWREALDNPSRALAQESRAADLIVMGAYEGAATGDAYRRADPGSVALQAGRPLLVVARNAEQIRAENIVVAWKDTREARRAVADALPLLQSADNVTVVAVTARKEPWVEKSIADVEAFLACHGVRAGSEILESPDESSRLVEFITASHADLVISGAYGHSRLREWAFGGMTRSLLDETGLSRFMSS